MRMIFITAAILAAGPAFAQSQIRIPDRLLAQDRMQPAGEADVLLDDRRRK